MHFFLLLLALLREVHCQQAGTVKPEVHPQLTTSTCTSSGCTTSQNSVVLDANWRWLHSTNGYTNCYTGQTWDTQLCPDPTTCAANCALDGADYQGTYGITTNGDSLTLKFVTGSNVGSRVYLMNSANSQYQLFDLLNKEFTFDVDVSQLPCGLNGALYFVNMDADGGLFEYSGNKAGAKYGTGYCDAQCPQDIKFINGQANILDWTGSSTDPNSGTGEWGSCCTEMDIWESNSISSAFTAHPCSSLGQTRCESPQDCGAGSYRYSGQCDKDGCDFNSYREGNTTFFGPSGVVDTSSPMTVVTQFVASSGTLTQINRLFVQSGRVIQNSVIDIPSVPAVNYLSDTVCKAQKSAFGDEDSFSPRGGMAQVGRAFGEGMVLVMSIWDDTAEHMLWLDADYPASANADKPGVARGSCGPNSGVPATVQSQTPNAQVVFSNIRSGPIGSTYGH